MLACAKKKDEVKKENSVAREKQKKYIFFQQQTSEVKWNADGARKKNRAEKKNTEHKTHWLSVLMRVHQLNLSVYEAQYT